MVLLDLRRQFNWTNVPIAVAADRCLKGLKRALFDAELTMAVPPSAIPKFEADGNVLAARACCAMGRARRRRGVPRARFRVRQRKRTSVVALAIGSHVRLAADANLCGGEEAVDTRWTRAASRHGGRRPAVATDAVAPLPRSYEARVFPSTTLQALGSK